MSRKKVSISQALNGNNWQDQLNQVLSGQTVVTTRTYQFVPAIDEEGNPTYRKVPTEEVQVISRSAKDAAIGLVIADRMSGGLLGISQKEALRIDVNPDEFMEAVNLDLDESIVDRNG